MSREVDPHNPETDVALLTRMRDGDVAAFEALYVAYHPRLWRFAHGYVRAADVAEDIVQEVFLSLWRRRTQISVERIGVYLYGAVRNLALRERRRDATASRVAHAAHAVEQPAHTAVASSNPHADVENREMDAAIEAALATMPEMRRTAFRLRWRDELTFPEIAEVLGISVEAAQMHVARARAALRETFERIRTRE